MGDGERDGAGLGWSAGRSNRGNDDDVDATPESKICSDIRIAKRVKSY